MSADRTRRLAWTTLALSLIASAGGLVFSVLTASTPQPGPSGVLFDSLFTLVQLTFPVVGALIATRHPENPIGWLCCASGLALAISDLANGYAVYALLTEPGSLPAGAVAAWLNTWLFVAPVFLTGPLLFLLFPDGRLLSRRWRPVFWYLLVSVALIVVSSALKPGPLDPPFEHVDNPLGIPGAHGLFSTVQVLGFFVVLSVPAAAAALVVRFRRSTGERRLQLKWLAYAAVVCALGFVAAGATFGTRVEWLGQLLVLTGISTVPLAAGQAILKHRLYDIDVVINRTLVYGLLTASLGAVYVGSVLLLQLALDSFTSNSSLAVAISTLGVAALFRPARARIQAAVDRRFYRSRYDATRTLEGFSARLREQVDLDALGGELRGVVAETMQPAHVSLWLRSPEAGR
jgi:hypothetical protein